MRDRQLFETLMHAHREIVVAGVVSDQRECELGRPGAEVAPRKSGRRMVEQVKPRVQRPAIDRDLVRAVVWAESSYVLHVISPFLGSRVAMTCAISFAIPNVEPIRPEGAAGRPLPGRPGLHQPATTQVARMSIGSSNIPSPQLTESRA